uniref:Uncharacterized protein LOC105036698 n=1 Tax=Elaeis guineensis var. tenera TaxID=51953 RepID=A0A8N4ESE7_ELAGV|nr:uncharacterized protein LOC105036698 [Elaeis guineensis]
MAFDSSANDYYPQEPADIALLHQLHNAQLRQSCSTIPWPLDFTYNFQERFLAFSPEQHPIVLQIGGSNLENLAKAAELANAYSFDEINLNCGCPSGKVAGHGCFGARLMLDPKFVADAMSAIAANCGVPVSVKCRIGVDDRDSYDELCDFVYTVVSNSPTRHFIIHARKALLSGLSPAENRKVPPLKYVYTNGSCFNLSMAHILFGRILPHSL